MLQFIYALMLSLAALNLYAWNKEGHQVVAQIAYENLTPKAKKMCHKYLHHRSRKTANHGFINAASWPDQIKWRGIYWYDKFHYIDLPFSNDGTPLPPVESTNALWAINNAKAVLQSKKTLPADKKFALRMLIHIIGDIHQPLHAASRISNQYPNGDSGGNLFELGPNNVGDNLHKYWDNGAGWLLGNGSSYRKKAKALEKKWPCSSIDTQINPEQWVKESHALAVNHAYQLNPKAIPVKEYQKKAQFLTQKQMVTSGCRLAALLNDIV